MAAATAASFDTNSPTLFSRVGNIELSVAIAAYAQSVALLSEVMERVKRGEDSGESRRRNGRRRSIVAQEEEVKRLKSIVRH